MTYGLEVIKNKSDDVVIDGKSQLLRVLTSGVVTGSDTTLPNWAFYNSTGNPYGPWHDDIVRRYDIPIPTGLANDPIIMIDWPVGSSFFQTAKTGNNMIIANPEKNAPLSLSYYVVGWDAPTFVDNYGIAIWDENGNLTYSSAASYLRQKEIIITPPSAAVLSGQAYVDDVQTHVYMPDPGMFSVPMLDYHTPENFGYYLGQIKRTSNTQMSRTRSAYGTDATLKFRWGNPSILLGSL